MLPDRMLNTCLHLPSGHTNGCDYECHRMLYISSEMEAECMSRMLRA